MLKTGDLVTINAKNTRYVPYGKPARDVRLFHEPLNRDEWVMKYPDIVRKADETTIQTRRSNGTIPDQTPVMYMGSHISSQGRFGSSAIVFHLVMWVERTVWISADDADLNHPAGACNDNT